MDLIVCNVIYEHNNTELTIIKNIYYILYLQQLDLFNFKHSLISKPFTPSLALLNKIKECTEGLS